jgi:hypothetical protein
MLATSQRAPGISRGGAPWLVHWKSGRRTAEASYTQQIEFFPGYRHPVRVAFNVDTNAVGNPPANDDYPPEPH